MERRAGGLSPPRQLQIEQMGADSTTACTSPRTRWRSLRVCLRVFALRVRVSVCERGFACACVCVSVWAGFVACPASVLRTPGRPRAPAAARTAAAVVADLAGPRYRDTQVVRVRLQLPARSSELASQLATPSACHGVRAMLEAAGHAQWASRTDDFCARCRELTDRSKARKKECTNQC